MSDKDDDDRNWHLDKRVPIALIVALLGNIVATSWWAATASEKLATLERRIEQSAPQADRLTRVETKLENVQDTLTDIRALMLRQKPNQ